MDLKVFMASLKSFQFLAWFNLYTLLSSLLYSLPIQRIDTGSLRFFCFEIIGPLCVYFISFISVSPFFKGMASFSMFRFFQFPSSRYFDESFLFIVSL